MSERDQAHTPYASALVSSAKQLREKYNEAGVITHAVTKGALREAYLRGFIRGLMPGGCHTTSGFITDSKGQLTPQLDIIGFDDTLPSISLDTDIKMVPIEATKFWIEVKSNLKTKHLENIKQRLSSVENMTWSMLLGAKPADFRPQFLPRGFIVAFESEVAHDTLTHWIGDLENLVAIIIIDKSYYWNLTAKHEFTEHSVTDGCFSETIFLYAKLHQLFVLMSRALEMARLRIASRETKTDELDLVHYGIQTYTESR